MNIERGELLQYALMWTAGIGILTLMLAPLAIPILALTAVALVPLAIPPIAFALVGAVAYGAFRLVRGAGRHIGRHLHRTNVPSEGRVPRPPVTGRLGISSRS